MDFNTSTHRNKWLFTQEQIDERRKAANDAGVRHVMAIRQEHDLPTDNLEPLTPADELIIINHWCSMLGSERFARLCPRKVVATAITFFRRFYLYASCMQHDAMRICLACIYIAGKVCEHYIDASKLEELVPSVKAREVLELETIALGVLQFDMVVYHPYHCIDAMVEELRKSSEKGDSVLEPLRRKQHWVQTLHKTSHSHADSIVRSDAALMVAPHHQALCAVVRALKGLELSEDAILQRYAVLAAEHSDKIASDRVLERMQALHADVERLYLACRQTSKQEAANMDKKLREFNPAMNRSSEVYKKIRARKRKRSEEGD